jgi:hypothetical protein
MTIPANPPGNATRPIEIVWDRVRARWAASADSWGVFNCRNIAGTHTPSQHAWGNAWDIHPHSMGVGDAIARFLRESRNRDVVAQVLWRVPDHYDHIHVSGRPMKVGKPPCMGGAGPGDSTTRERELPASTKMVRGESWAPAIRVATTALNKSTRVTSDQAARIRRIISRG